MGDSDPPRPAVAGERTPSKEDRARTRKYSARHHPHLPRQSKPGAKTSPSSAGQLALAKHLQQELVALGLQDIVLSKHCVLTAFLPSNVDSNAPTIGFISHLDTSPDCSGKNVQPEVIENYRGGDIALGIGEEFSSPVYYPFLHQLIGKILIVTDGNTLSAKIGRASCRERV